MPLLATRSSASRPVAPLRGGGRRLVLAVFAAAGLVALSGPAHALGTWSKITASPPTGAGTVQLLTDGRILIGNGTTGWYTLTPDSAGKYEGATWSSVGQIANSHVVRGFFPSTILNDGRFIIGGGEYISGYDRATMEIYDPVADTWTTGPDMPKPIGDTAASILDDGTFLVSSVWFPQVYLFNPTANTWTQKADIGTGGSGDEKGWTLLPSGKVIDIFDKWSVYTPSTNSWTTAVAPPVTLIGYPPGAGAEIGPMSLLHTGQVVQFGAAATGVGAAAHTAVFNPSNSSWTVGPDAPDGLQFGDSPAAVMFNGNVLCVTTPQADGGAAVDYYEYVRSLSQFTFHSVNAPATDLGGVLFLNLPTGQILVAGNGPGANWYLYNPSGAPLVAWRPVINSISSPTAGEFTLTGTRLNGLTTGSSFGDDENMATNFPIVSLVDSAQTHTYYARSYGFDHMAPGAATSTKFVLPVAIPNGTYTVHVTANGVGSNNTSSLTVSGTHVTQLSGGSTSVKPGSTTTWTVSVSTAAPAGGTAITLASNNTGVATVPASVTIPQGAKSAAFTLTSRGFGRAIISAQASNTQFKAATRMFGWTVSTIVSGVALDLSHPDAPFTATVTISNAAPTGGVVVNLSSNLAGVTVPATVTIPAGSTQSAAFNIGANVNPSVAVVYASLFNSSQFTGLTLDNRWAWLQTMWQ